MGAIRYIHLLVIFINKKMSRNNVFKLSGNMALGSNQAYSNSDFENIKSSLKLLKSKQPQKKQDMPLQPTNYYGGSYSSNAPSRQQPNSKNNPNHDYQNSYNYPSNAQNYNKNGPQTNSYKDVYQQPESNPLKQKRNIPNYQQEAYQDKNTYQKYPPKVEQKEYRQAPPQPQRHNNQPATQEKSIKEVNRQNRIQIKEYDPSQLIQCSEGCGRKFNPDSISKHEGVCRQVFQKKRKEFNAQDQRLVANEQKKLMKKGELVDKKLQQKKAKEKIPKWKAESLQLRSGLKQARNDDYQPTKEEKQILDSAKNSQFTKCEFCGRSFNQQAAKKHIPFCESQQKKNQMKRR